jgi:hypothetical protein
MNTHENLPALNRYTSATQYEALKEINETNSIIKIVQQGRSSKTLGALIRSMWIKQRDYTDDNGVLREGWFVTDEGLHAMNVFAEKERLKEEEKERERERFRSLVDNMDALAKVVHKHEARFVELNAEILQMKQDIHEAQAKTMHDSWHVSNEDLRRLLVSFGLPPEWFRAHTRKQHYVFERY